MTATLKSPGEIRELLEEAEISVTSKRWPDPGFVIIDGERYSPHSESGTLLIDGEPIFSAAWR